MVLLEEVVMPSSIGLLRENLERLIRIAMALIGATMGIGFRVQGMFNSFGS